ncbi:MAG: response regulator [Sedimentisphaerales bacterium]|nr:response regulator [Sedimentisphaerales bacterium]
MRDSYGSEAEEDRLAYKSSANWEKQSTSGVPLHVFSVAVAVTLLLLAMAGMSTWTIHQRMEKLITDQVTTEQLAGRIDANLREFRRGIMIAGVLVAASALILLSVWPWIFLRAKRSIIERRQARENIGEMNRELQHSIDRANLLARNATATNQARSDFLASMSHEIRTPMNAIVGFAEVLKDGPLTGEQKAHIDIIKDSAHSLLKTLSNILDISKIEAGRLDVEIGQCRVDRLLNSIESMMRPQAEEKDLEFHVAANGAMPPVIRTDALRLRQCLVNLVHNAIKFTEHGYVCINANLQKDNRKAYIRFDIEDTGIGITPEDRHAIFESFVQSKKHVGSFPRTGLGLTITRHLAELLGGSLSLTSEPGRGSVFSLVIPAGVDIDAMRSGKSPAPCRPESSEEIDLDGVQFEGRVLVAEDAITNQMLIKLLLEKMGFDVTVVKDGREAVNKAESGEFDLIFMDIHMPNMDGCEATRILRKKGITAPIVALTADAMKGDDRKCLAAGCNDYLPKPIDRKWLLCILQKYLDPVNIAIASSDAPMAS